MAWHCGCGVQASDEHAAAGAGATRVVLITREPYVPHRPAKAVWKAHASVKAPRDDTPGGSAWAEQAIKTSMMTVRIFSWTDARVTNQAQVRHMVRRRSNDGRFELCRSGVHLPAPEAFGPRLPEALGGCCTQRANKVCRGQSADTESPRGRKQYQRLCRAKRFGDDR